MWGQLNKLSTWGKIQENPYRLQNSIRLTYSTFKWASRVFLWTSTVEYSLQYRYKLKDNGLESYGTLGRINILQAIKNLFFYQVGRVTIKMAWQTECWQKDVTTVKLNTTSLRQTGWERYATAHTHLCPQSLIAKAGCFSNLCITVGLTGPQENKKKIKKIRNSHGLVPCTFHHKVSPVKLVKFHVHYFTSSLIES